MKSTASSECNENETNKGTLHICTYTYKYVEEPYTYVHNVMLPKGAKGAFDAELRSEIKVHCTFNIGVGSS